MKKGIPAHVPRHQRHVLEQMVRYITKMAKPEKILLFGSYARGEAVVEHWTVKDGHMEVYESDLDILVLVKNEKDKKSDVWHKIDEKLKDNPLAPTPVHIITETVEDMNSALRLGRYFYADIAKEGSIIWEKDDTKLVTKVKPTLQEKYHMALDDFRLWYGYADEFYYYRFLPNFQKIDKSIFASHFNRREQIRLNLTAFDLQQATECAYYAAHLVFLAYKPKTHDIEKLATKIEPLDSRFAVFSRRLKKNAELFDLLRRAYAEARYSLSYIMLPDKMEILSGRVWKLLHVTKRLCEAHISTLEKDAYEGKAHTEMELLRKKLFENWKSDEDLADRQ